MTRQQRVTESAGNNRSSYANLLQLPTIRTV